MDLEGEKIGSNANKISIEAALAHSEVQNENGEATSTNNRASTDQMEEATYQWNMEKELGVTIGTEHDKIIDIIRAMEKRDRTEPERLGNRNIIP